MQPRPPTGPCHTSRETDPHVTLSQTRRCSHGLGPPCPRPGQRTAHFCATCAARFEEESAMASTAQQQQWQRVGGHPPSGLPQIQPRQERHTAGEAAAWDYCDGVSLRRMCVAAWHCICVAPQDVSGTSAVRDQALGLASTAACKRLTRAGHAQCSTLWRCPDGWKEAVEGPVAGGGVAAAADVCRRA